MAQEAKGHKIHYGASEWADVSGYQALVQEDSLFDKDMIS